MGKLNVGVIGLGVGEKHVLAFNEHPACEVVSLCDLSDEKLFNTARHCQNAKLTKQSTEILDDPTIDIISIASYDNYHFDQIVRGIQNGKHIFVEKPLCLHAHEAVEIRRLLNGNPSLRLSSNLNLRTCPRFIRMKKAASSGELGRIFYLEGDYLWGRISKLTKGWRKGMEFYSIVHGAAVHIIDLLMWITEERPVEVQGYGNGIATSGSEFRYNDFAAILMKFQDGAVAKVSAHGGCVHPHFHRINIYGTEKTFIHDVLGGKLLEYTDTKSEIKEVLDDYPAVKEKGKVITTFVDSIIDPKSKPIVPTKDVFATMSVCFAVDKAVQEGRPISVEYI